MLRKTFTLINTFNFAARSKPSFLTITDNAKNRIQQIISKGKNDNIVGLKVSLTKKGCSGLSYKMDYIKPQNINKFDQIIQTEDGIKIVIDNKALMAIVGSQLDFVESQLGKEFDVVDVDKVFIFETVKIDSNDYLICDGFQYNTSFIVQVKQDEQIFFVHLSNFFQEILIIDPLNIDKLLFNHNFIRYLICQMKKPTPTQPQKTSQPPAKQAQKRQQTRPFNVDDYVRWDLSREQVTQIKQAFDIFDNDGSGIMDPSELKDAFINLGFTGQGKFVYQILAELDEDQSGGIEFPEFLKLATAKLSDKDSRQDIMKVFNTFDVNRAGKFTSLELKKVAKDIGEDVTDNDIEDMLHRADLDDDGFVTFEDFYNIMTHKVYWDK